MRDPCRIPEDKLAMSCPTRPLDRFKAETAIFLARPRPALGDPADRSERFPSGFIGLVGSRCPLTGITNPALLRASHIVP